MAWQPGSQWIFYRVSGTTNRYMIAWTAGSCQRYLGAPRACQATTLQVFSGASGAGAMVWEVAPVGGGEPVPAAVQVVTVSAGSASTVNVAVRKAATPGERRGWSVACL